MVRKKRKAYWRSTLGAFWLLWSMSGSVLFGFGLLALLNKNGTLLPVIVGGVMVTIAVFTHKLTTETATAMKVRK